MKIYKYFQAAQLLKSKQFEHIVAEDYHFNFSDKTVGRALCELRLFTPLQQQPRWQGTLFHTIALCHQQCDEQGIKPLIKSLPKRLPLWAKNHILNMLFIVAPQQALIFYQHYYTPTNLLLALTLKCRLADKNTNKEQLKICLDQLHGIPDPQAKLLASLLVKEQPLQQLFYLNQMFASYGLSEITLKNDKDKLTVTNITANPYSVNQKENMPLISVLMTTFNSEAYIAASLSSLLQQTYSNVEIIIIDDCSGDNTRSLITKFAAQYRNIKYLFLTENIGTYAAKNIGFRYASGEFITCHDSDDYAHPEKLAQQIIPLLQDKHKVASFSKWFRLDEQGAVFSRHLTPFIRLNPSSALFRKKQVVEKAGLWDWVTIGADSEFNARLRLIFGHEAISFVDKPLTIGSHRKNSLMTADKTGYSGQGAVLRQQYWESWQQWHINCLIGKRPPRLFLSQTAQRPFNAPADILVNNGIRQITYQHF